MALGLEDKPLKAKAQGLANVWQQQVLPAVRNATTDAQVQTILSGPIAELRSFKSTVLGRLMAGEWLGWLYPLFIQHVLNELDYAASGIYSVGPSASDTVGANLRFLAEHAAFAAHLLDPTQQKAIQDAVGTEGKFDALQAQCCNDLTPTFLALTAKETAGMNQWLEQSGLGTPKGPKSIVHPVLAAHVLREGQRSLSTFQRIQTNLPSAGPVVGRPMFVAGEVRTATLQKGQNW